MHKKSLYKQTVYAYIDQKFYALISSFILKIEVNKIWLLKYLRICTNVSILMR